MARRADLLPYLSARASGKLRQLAFVHAAANAERSADVAKAKREGISTGVRHGDAKTVPRRTLLGTVERHWRSLGLLLSRFLPVNVARWTRAVRISQVERHQPRPWTRQQSPPDLAR